MDRLLPLFLKFLRAGLWEEDIDNSVSLTRQDWEELYGIAYKQAVTGLFIDGVSRTTMRPDEDIWEKWMVHLLFMERNNRFIAERGQRWIEELKKAGIASFVFKGTSVATWYPLPLHRSYGDVDIVVKSGWEQLPQTLQRWGAEPYRLNGEEIVVKEKSGLFVELHNEWEHLYNPVTDARLKSMCAATTENNNELYFVCLIVHLQRHFFTYGIGLKQVCDVAAMLHSAGIDRRKVAEMLRAINAEKFSRHLFGFIEKYLGGTENYPLPPVRDKKRLTLLENVIFGESYSLKKRQEQDAANNRHSFARILENALFWSRRCARVSGLMAGEACCFLLHKAWRRIGMLFTNNAK
jgi:hypothetical protein